MFSTTDAPAAKGPCRGTDIELELLTNAQAYIHSLVESRAPTPQLCGAWAEFYELCNPLIHRLVQTCCMSAADTDDCMQEVWAEIVSKLGRFDCDPRHGRFQSWLFTLTRHKATDFIRSRAAKSSPNIDERGMSPCCRDLDPAAAYEQQQKRRIVRNVLADLRRRISAANYQILHLRLIEGHSVPEVATRLDLTPAQVRYRLYRVKQKLRQMLEVRGVCDPEGG